MMESLLGDLLETIDSIAEKRIASAQIEYHEEIMSLSESFGGCTAPAYERCAREAALNKGDAIAEINEWREMMKRKATAFVFS